MQELNKKVEEGELAKKFLKFLEQYSDDIDFLLFKKAKGEKSKDIFSLAELIFNSAKYIEGVKEFLQLKINEGYEAKKKIEEKKNE